MIISHNRLITVFKKKITTSIRVLFLTTLSITAYTQSFITTWKSDNPGSSSATQIKIPTTGSGYNYNIVWSEVGNPTNTGALSNVLGGVTIDFPSPGTYKVEISGQFPRIYFNAASFRPDGDSHKLLTIEQWGNIAWTSMSAAFSGCINLRVNASDVPDLSGVTDLSEMFYQATSFNDNINNWDVSTITNMARIFREAESFNQPLNLWDVSNVKDMTELFYFNPAFNKNIGNWDVSSVTNMSSTFAYATAFNQDISSWDVSAVTLMGGTFAGAASFNQNIGGWVVSNVTYLSGTFAGTTGFNQDISSWDVSNVTNMSGLFRGNTTFNPDINSWDLSSVTDMSYMFSGATGFTQDISGWDVSNVKNMSSMFEDLPDFNQDITSWDVTNVTEMNSMFEGATSFNRDISSWDVKNVLEMNGMFLNAKAFNQNIGSWDVTKVTDMRQLFSGASSFNQDLRSWNIINVRYLASMLNNCGISLENYDRMLEGWAALPLKSNVSFGASNLFYCSGEAARAAIIANFNWFIADAGQRCINVYAGTNTAGVQLANGQPSPFNFGSINVGATKTRSFTIENKQAIPITNVVITISGSAFTTSSIPVTIPANGSVTITVDFSSVSASTFLEALTITSDNFNSNFQFPLIGEVTAAPQPEIVITQGPSPNGIQINDGDSFGYYVGYELRGNNVINNFTIANLGSAPLVISNLEITGTVFSLGSGPPLIIPIDNSVTIDVTLDGAVADNFYETLTITNNDVDEGVFDFGVAGDIYGPEISAFDGNDIDNDPEIFNGQSTAIDFGSSSLGIDVMRPIALTNYGPLDLTISSISISGTAFSINIIPPLDIGYLNDGIEDIEIMNVTLSGAVGGVFNETISIFSNDDSDPVFQFSLTGTIIVGSCVNPPSVSIGLINNVCENNPILLAASIGGAASSITWTTTGDGNFNDASLLSAVYTPGANDIATGSVDFTITTNDPDGVGPCAVATETKTVSISRAATVAAGVDQISCNTDVVILSGTMNTFASSPQWSTNGTGVFSAFDALATNYTPSAADIASGLIIITLAVNGSGVCPQVLDQLLITILKPIVADNPSIDVSIGQPATINVLAGSTTNAADIITVSILQDGTKGTATITPDKSIRYEANVGTVGNDLIQYRICNQCSLCSDGTITSTILNLAPIINQPTDPIETVVGQSVTIPISSLLSDPNANLDLSTLKIISGPTSNAATSFNSNFDLILDYSTTSFVGLDLITIEICDALNLCSQLSMQIYVEGNIIVYNGVSPNEDGKNDYFKLENIQLLEPENKVTIYNRWGSKVFDIENYNNDDKRFIGVNNNGNLLPSGVYFYKIEFIASEREQLSGYLTIRN